MTKKQAIERNWQDNRLLSLGMEQAEIDSLRRISMTLHSWFEAECGGGNDYASTCLERDEETGVPYRVTYPHTSNKVRRVRIPDRETGAKNRLAKIMANHPKLLAFIQGDCRGCALYILSKAELKDRDAESCYSSFGVAVY